MMKRPALVLGLVAAVIVASCASANVLKLVTGPSAGGGGGAVSPADQCLNPA
jgi:hypothetical protein